MPGCDWTCVWTTGWSYKSFICEWSSRAMCLTIQARRWQDLIPLCFDPHPIPQIFFSPLFIHRSYFPFILPSLLSLFVSVFLPVTRCLSLHPCSFPFMCVSGVCNSGGYSSVCGLWIVASQELQDVLFRWCWFLISVPQILLTDTSDPTKTTVCVSVCVWDRC